MRFILRNFPSRGTSCWNNVDFLLLSIIYYCWYWTFTYLRSCVEQCEKSGCVGNKCFQHCKFSSDGKPIDGPWYMQEPLYLRWKQWDCRSDCRYQCMLAREEEREKLGDKPVKYHGKWPFQRVYGIQVFDFVLSCQKRFLVLDLSAI